jgi:hypothetical protein
MPETFYFGRRKEKGISSACDEIEPSRIFHSVLLDFTKYHFQCGFGFPGPRFFSEGRIENRPRNIERTDGIGVGE